MRDSVKDAAVVTSKYNHNGQDKSRWTNVGALFQNDDGSMFLSLNAFFNFSALQRKDGSDRVIIGLFDPKPRDNQNGNNNSSSSYSSSGNFGFDSNNDSGVPF